MTDSASALRTRKSPSRASVLGVHSLDHFVFSVPDLDVAARFYEAFGLDVRRQPDRLVLHTHGHPQAWGSLFQADGPKRLQYLRFAAFAQDLDALAVRARQLDLPAAEPHPLAEAGGFWLRHPDGYAVQVVAAAKSSPDTKSARSVEPEPTIGKGASLARSAIPQVRPRRLSHVLLFSPDVGRSVAFYRDALGLRLSDSSADIIAFLHGVHGSDHHLVAFAKSDGPGLHHSSWDVGSIDEVGRGMEQMQTAGYAQGWGLGRHVLGSNYFRYVRDPWGSFCEYSFDIDFVPGDFDWRSADHPPEDSFYAWGPPVPEDFIVNHETQPR